MSSYPARLAKRAMKARGFVREYVKADWDPDVLFPHRVLDADSKPIAWTWTQAAVRASGRNPNGTRRVAARSAKPIARGARRAGAQ